MNTATALKQCRSVRGFHRYRVSEDGTVYVQKLHNGRGADKWKRVPVRMEDGFPCVTLTRVASYGEVFTARLRVCDIVLDSFVGKRPFNHQVFFRDGDVSNCRLENLEYRPYYSTTTKSNNNRE
jgi:hypothetical protein